MVFSKDELHQILDGGGDVVGPNGKIGSIGQIYLDDETGDPEWVTVKTGLFGTSESFVPLQGASLRDDDIVVQFDKDTVKDAPRLDADGSLSPDEERQLYAHYGMADDYDRRESTYAVGEAGIDDDATRGRSTDTDDRTDVRNDRQDRVDEAGTEDYDTSGPTTDDAMTLSEERLQVGTQTEEAGRVRLKKYVVTENVTQTVPVRREEVRLEREPITDANIGNATEGPAISEEEHEIVLHEERPVVQKETVPVERVRLGTETVTDQVEVTEEVRKEQIDTDLVGDADKPAPRR